MFEPYRDANYDEEDDADVFIERWEPIAAEMDRYDLLQENVGFIRFEVTDCSQDADPLVQSASAALLKASRDCLSGHYMKDCHEIVIEFWLGGPGQDMPSATTLGWRGLDWVAGCMLGTWRTKTELVANIASAVEKSIERMIAWADEAGREISWLELWESWHQTSMQFEAMVGETNEWA